MVGLAVLHGGQFASNLLVNSAKGPAQDNLMKHFLLLALLQIKLVAIYSFLTLLWQKRAMPFQTIGVLYFLGGTYAIGLDPCTERIHNCL